MVADVGYTVVVSIDPPLQRAKMGAIQDPSTRIHYDPTDDPMIVDVLKVRYICGNDYRELNVDSDIR